MAKIKDDALPPLQYFHSGRRMTRCQADDDDHCDYKGCPQHRDGEPEKSGRHCPLDTGDNIREMED